MSERATVAEWAGAIAAPSPSPAGGSAGALSAALAAAVVEMVAGMTERRERYAEVRDAMAAARARGAALRGELLGLAAEDAAAFAAFERALALPSGSGDERSARDQAKRHALRDGARIQREVLDRAAEVSELAAMLASDALKSALGDSAAAGFLAAAVARSSYWAWRADLADGAESAEALRDGQQALQRAEGGERRIRQLVRRRIG